MRNTTWPLALLQTCSWAPREAGVGQTRVHVGGAPPLPSSSNGLSAWESSSAGFTNPAPCPRVWAAQARVWGPLDKAAGHQPAQMGITAFPGSVRPQKPRPCDHDLGEDQAVAEFMGSAERVEDQGTRALRLARHVGSRLPQNQPGPDPRAWTRSLAGLGGAASPSRDLFNIPGRGGWEEPEAESSARDEQRTREGAVIPAPGPLPAPCCSFAMLECSVPSLPYTWLWGLSSVGTLLTTWLNLVSAQPVPDPVSCYFLPSIYPTQTPSGRVFVNSPLPHPSTSRLRLSEAAPTQQTQPP